MSVGQSADSYNIDILETMVRRCHAPDDPQVLYTYLQLIDSLANNNNKTTDQQFSLGQRAAEILYECAKDENLPNHYRVLTLDNIYIPIRLMSEKADTLNKKGVLLNLRYRLSALVHNFN
ncbi:MAG: hypothetical protein AAGJ37_05195 [Pseudomonadota bacterium]